MKIKPLILLPLTLLVTVSVSWATTRFIRPGWDRVEAIYSQALESGTLSSDALDELQGIAEDDSLTGQVRGHALTRLGDLARRFNGSAVEAYLRDLVSQEGFPGGLRSVAHLEYWETVVDRQDSQDAMETLSRLVEPKVAGGYWPMVGRWAANESCNRGYFDSRVREALTTGYGSDRGGKEAAACELKARIVRETSSEIEAYEAALRQKDPSSLRSLHGWAIEGLANAETTEANLVLLDYVLRSQSSPDPAEQSAVRFAMRKLHANGWTVQDLKKAGVENVPVYFHN